MNKGICFIFVFFLQISLFAQWTTIKNGALWKDTEGNPVQAHGAGFLQVDTIWYMVGEDRSYSNAGVNLYSTTDFVNWKFIKKIIPPSAYRSDRFIERPKLMRSPATGKFVVWCHYEGANYGPSEAASFVCDSVDGLYTLIFSGRPFDIPTRDCNVFTDFDGKGYFVSTTDGNANLTLFELSDDYLRPVKSTRLTAFNGKSREAPAIVRINSTYFLISSKCTGWDPNQATISYSSSLTSGWSAMSNLGNSISFDTQAASILTVKGKSGTSYLYVGDRWQDPALAESKTIIFPVSFSGNTCNFNYRQQFDIDFTTGLTRETPVSNRVPKSAWKVRQLSSQETTKENGAASNVFDGNLSTKWHTKYNGSVAPAPHYIEIDMGAEYTVSGLLATPRQDNSINGLVREFVLYVSVNGTDWTPVAGASWMPYFSEIYFQPVQARYFRFTALSGTYASLAEIDLLQSVPDFTPHTLTPNYQIGAKNSGSWRNSSQVTINKWNCLHFGPTLIKGGSWAWAGPLWETWADREISIGNISKSGTYTALYLNNYNCMSTIGFNVTVTEQMISVKRKLQNALNKARASLLPAVGRKEETEVRLSAAEALLQNSAATYAELESEAEVLTEAMKKYFTQIRASSEDVSSLIAGEGKYTSLTPTGWSGTSLTATGSNWAEFSGKTFDFHQTIPNLANGYYLVAVQAFYRPGSSDGGYNYSYGIENSDVSLYANNRQIALASVYSVPYSGPNNLYGYCNDSTSASAAFKQGDAPFTNLLLVEVVDGSLKMGLKKSVTYSNDWCIFSSFKLYRLRGELVGVDEVSDEKVLVNGPVYQADGRYCGTGSPESLHLKPGLYFSRGVKFSIR